MAIATAPTGIEPAAVTRLRGIKRKALVGAHPGIGGVEYKVLDEAKGIVEAYVSIYALLDSMGEIVDFGAYAKSLGGKLPKVAASHDWSTIIGKVTEAEEVAAGAPKLPEKIKAYGGLRTVQKYNLETQAGREWFSNIAGGYVDEFSIGYEEVETYNAKDGRHLKELRLFEVSPVLAGANPATEVVSAKARDAAAKHVVDGEWAASADIPCVTVLEIKGGVAQQCTHPAKEHHEADDIHFACGVDGCACGDFTYPDPAKQDAWIARRKDGDPGAVVVREQVRSTAPAHVIPDAVRARAHARAIKVMGDMTIADVLADPMRRTMDILGAFYECVDRELWDAYDGTGETPSEAIIEIIGLADELRSLLEDVAGTAPASTSGEGTTDATASTIYSEMARAADAAKQGRVLKGDNIARLQTIHDSAHAMADTAGHDLHGSSDDDGANAREETDAGRATDRGAGDGKAAAPTAVAGNGNGTAAVGTDDAATIARLERIAGTFDTVLTRLVGSAKRLGIDLEHELKKEKSR